MSRPDEDVPSRPTNAPFWRFRADKANNEAAVARRKAETDKRSSADFESQGMHSLAAKYLESSKGWFAVALAEDQKREHYAELERQAALNDAADAAAVRVPTPEDFKPAAQEHGDVMRSIRPSHSTTSEEFGSQEHSCVMDAILGRGNY